MNRHLPLKQFGWRKTSNTQASYSLIEHNGKYHLHVDVMSGEDARLRLIRSYDKVFDTLDDANHYLNTKRL